MGCDQSACSELPDSLNSDLILKNPSQISQMNDKSTNLSNNSLTQREADSKTYQPLLSLIEYYLESNSNYSDLLKLSQIWLHELIFFLNHSNLSPDNIRTTLTLDSCGKSLHIRHEVDGITTFEFIKFVSAKFSLIFQKDIKDLHEIEKNLKSLHSLTCIFYIRLGENYDFGFGVEKMLDLKQLTFEKSEDICRIIEWNNQNNQPVPTSVLVSVLENTKIINFYIFDGFRRQNVEKAFALFQMFGRPLMYKAEELFNSGFCDDVNCSVLIRDGRVEKVCLQVHCNVVSLEVVKSLGFYVDEIKWDEVRTKGIFRGLELEMNSEGYSLSQVLLYYPN
jgi:hypothetical protein